LKRHFFISYTTRTNFEEKKYDYHVNVIDFHKDSVDLKKLHRIENYSAEENFMIKRDKNGRYIIKNTWKDDTGNQEIKITAKQPSEFTDVSCGGLPRFKLNETTGLVQSNLPPSDEFKALYVSQYAFNKLPESTNNRYFEFVFHFDSAAYILTGYHDSLNKITSSCLQKLRKGHTVPEKIKAHRVEFTTSPRNKKKVISYPAVVKIEFDHFILTSAVPPVKQEIRSMKQGAWVGFSTCHLYYPQKLRAPEDNPEQGFVHIILL
jgi:hypothetical protein